MILDFNLLYDIYTQDFISLVQSEDFYTEFMNKAMSGSSEVSYMHRFIDKQIDVKWVEAIEEAIIPLDNIIRNPRRFIVQEEEVVNIELARKISPESIRHLAQHTNMIAKVEEDTVTPNRILNIFKEESFETYENRFIYTLLINLQYFISKRLMAINENINGNNVTSILFKDQFNIGKENVKCSFEMTIDSPGFKMDGDLLDVDPGKLSKFQRIERIKKILYDFQNSPLIKALSGTALVRPPIMRTNVLQKNPDFKKAKALWDFIETYRDAGFNVEVTETNEIPSELYLSELYSTMILNYSILKHHIGNEGDYEPQKRRKVITPQIIERTLMDMLDDLTFDIDMVQRIFNEQMAKSKSKRQKREKEILSVIDRALKLEQKRKDDIERAKQAELEKAKLEKQRLREEQKRKLEEEKQARLQEKLERQRQKEEELKRRAEEKLRKEQERLERQKALEREKELEKKRKEAARAKAQKEKQALLEKEKLRKAREQQRLKEQKAKELAKQKEAERKRKEAEKLRAQKEKQALEEKERQNKAKEQQRLKDQKAKELAQQIPGSFIPDQFCNPANRKAHFATTGPEIWQDTDGNVDIFIAGVGTGGTITGTGSYLKAQNPKVQVVAVEPAASPLLSGGKAGPHGLQGIGANFIPEVLDQSVIDTVIPVTEEEAYTAARLLGKKEGVLVGISSGAALHAAITLAQKPENAGKTIVILLPDTGDRYLSTSLFA